jgi:thiosulfate dehydrogenase (quinone) large subunit
MASSVWQVLFNKMPDSDFDCHNIAITLPWHCRVFHVDLSPKSHNENMVRHQGISQGRQSVALRAVTRPASNPLTALLEWISSETSKDGAALLPLRLFIALGWLRALAEKITNPAWFDGTALSGFLNTQLQAEKVAFPVYAWMISHVFLPGAPVLSWIILIGQLLVGLGLLFGAYSRAALVGGLFMNLNFIAAGMPSPSVFYVVMQIMLLFSNSGRVFGLDGIAHTTVTLRTLEQPVQNRIGRHQMQFRLSRNIMLVLAVICTVLAFSALPFAKDFSPKGSINDPAILMCVLGLFAAGQCLIRAIRGFSVHVG